MANNIKEYIESGLIPDDETVINAIETGKISSEEVIQKWKEYKQPVSTPVFKKVPVKSNNNIFKDRKREAVLTSMVDSGELPPDSKALDLIRSGKVSIDKMKYEWNIFKNKNEVIVGNNKGQINKEEDLKLSLDDEVKQFINSSDQKPLETPPPQAAQPMVEEENTPMKSFMKSLKEDEYVIKKYLSGLSMGIYEPEMEAPSTGSKVAGVVANVSGFLVSGFLGGVAIRGGLAATGVLSKGVPFIGTAIKGLEAGSKAAATTMKAAKAAGETVKWGTRLAKHGKAITALAAEGATLGAAVGTTKGLVRGENIEDSLSQGVVDAALWGGGAVALYPLVALAGGAFGMKETNKLRKVFAHLDENEIAKRIKTMGVDDLINLFEQAPNKLKDAEFQKAYIALKKIKASRPDAGPLLSFEVAKHPEILEETFKQQLNKTIDSLYVGDEAPLKFLLDESPLLRTMLKKGDNVGILESTKTLLSESIKKVNVAGDIATSPFLMDAKTSYEIIANRAVRKLEGKGIEGVDRSLFTSFFTDPSKANLAALKKAVPDAKVLRQSIGISPTSYMKGTKGLTDIRIDSRKASEIADDYLQTYFKTIASDGEISFADIGKLGQTQSIMRSATVMNKDFSRTMLEGHARLVDKEWMVEVKPELKDGVNAKIRGRAYAISASEDMANINNIKRSINNLPKDATPEVISESKKALKNALASRSNKIKNLRKIESDLSGYSPSDLKEIDALVEQIYTPIPSELGLSSTKMADYMSKFGGKENPLYIKNKSELADTLTMMLAAGKDVGYSSKEPWLRNLAKPFNPTFFASVQRKFRTQFGYNSTFDVLFREIKEKEILIKDVKKTLMDGLAKTGVSRNSKTSKMAMKLASAEITTGSEEFLALSPEIQKKVIDASQYVRKHYDKLFTDINSVRKDLGLKQFKYKQDYVTHIHKKGFKESIKESLSSTTSEMQEGTKVYNAKRKLQPDPTRPSFGGHEKHQTGKEGYVEDLVEAFESYLDPALESIHFAKLHRELDVMRGFAPQRVGDVLDHIKNNIFAHAENPFDKMTTNVIKKGTETFMRKRAEGLILGNLNVLFQQATSAALSTVISPRDSVAAVVKMFSKEYDELYKLSRNRALASPSEGIDFDKNLLVTAFKDGEGVIHGAKAAYNYYKHFLSYGFKKFDLVARRHAFVTAAEYAQRKGIKELAIANGSDPMQSVLSYADDWADMIHGSFGKIDRPEVLRSTLGRAFFQFQSFSMNLATTMMYDMPRMAFKEGAYKVTRNLLETGAAMSLINEICLDAGIPEPFDLAMMLPGFSTYRYGNSGMAQATYDFIAAAASDDKKRKGAVWRNVVSAASSVAFPGSKQFYKGTQAFGRITTKRNELTFDTSSTRGYNKPMAMAFGSYPQYKKELIEKAPTGWRKKVARKVKRKLFK